MREPVRCGVCFDTVEEFRAAFLARGRGLCFVAYPDEVEAGRLLIIDINLAQRVRLELDGLAQQPDFDDRGNTGVLVALSAESSAILEKLEVDLRHSPLPEVFATSRTGQPGQATGTGTGAVPTMGTEAGLAHDPLLEPGTMVDDRFRIESHLATGGMGEVYRANHVHLKRPVALKLLRRVFAGDSDMWARFQREAELVSQLESPHIVRVFDFGRTHDGQPYLAMEFVEGTTLDVLLEAGPLAPARAADLLAQVCTGLTEAHAVGVIHRDLKPANLIVGRRRDGSEVLKILDFGIARLGDQAGRSEKQKLTQLGIVVGTPAYLAPEQALADDLDHRTDLYALGCVAYELLTGGPPFRSPDLSKVLSLHLTATPAPLESLRPELAARPQLCAAVLKALSKEREQRFSSAAEFAHALTAAPPDDGLWPPETAAPPRPSASVSALPVSPATEVDDFFEASTPASNRPPPRAVAPVTAATGLAARLASARDALPPAATRAAFLFVEVLGVQAESPAARAALERALEVAAVFGGFGEASDEDGVVLGFAATAQPPVLRAAYAALAMRDAVAFDAAQSGSTARLRCGLVVDELTRPRPATSTALARSRALCARAQAGQVACDRLLAPDLSTGLELSNGSEVLLATARRAPRRGATQLVGRASTFDLLERRLVGLQQGVVAPLVVRGPEGSGRTAIALELALRARQRSLVVVHVTATPSWARAPGSLVAALVCAALGVPMSERARLLPSALEALKLPAPVIEAVLVVSGVVQPTWAFTAGQAAQALRAVLKAGALERPVVLVIDGIEHVDQQGLGAFGELVTRPAARELTLAFASPTLAPERLAGATVSELPALSTSEVGQLVTQALGVAGGPRLAAFLLERAGGQPAATLEWLAWLEERGALKLGAVAELVDDVPELADAALPAARLALVPPEVARALEAATCQGETFDAAGVMTAYPGATQAVVALAAARFMPVAGRRWAFQRARDASAVALAPSAERPAMHQRLAVAQVELGRTNPAGVDPLEVGQHFLAAGDSVRAMALLQHAAEAAVARHAPRQAAVALKGLAAALALGGGTSAGPRRVESLARAAALCLSAQDAAGARVELDAAVAVAAQVGVDSAELWLVQARVLRSEARRARTAEALSRAQAAAMPELAALVAVERAESLEQEGDLAGAMVATEAALTAAPSSSELARWHGEVDLVARLEARLAALCLQRKDLARARQLFESSAQRWRASRYPAGEARALSNLGASCALARDLPAAIGWFTAAAEAGARSGDFLFQARALLQLAKAQKKHEPAGTAARATATEARRLAMSLGWEQGRLEATALIE